MGQDARRTFRPWVIGLLAIFGVAGAQGEDRSAAIRIHLSRSKGGPDDVLESVEDVRKALRDPKVAPNLVEVPAGEKAEFELVVTRRFRNRAPQRNDLQEGTLYYFVSGLVVVAPERTAVDVDGSGIVWRQAAIDLARNVDGYARAHQHEFLRERPDWPDPGFEFAALTKERESQFGTTGGEAVVTAVKADGPAARAGLQVGDALLKLANRKVETAGDVGRALYVAPSGSVLRLEVAQKGARRAVT
jgi:membrane-associated protease RseP (regulator of RpoE activity)